MSKLAALRLIPRAVPFALPGLGGHLARRRLPRLDGTLALPATEGYAPTAPIELLRDTWGTVHVFAATELDALFGQGFAHAQDRRWQLDAWRRICRGELAALMGAPAVPVDRLMRTMGLRRTAERWAAGLKPEIRALLLAYAAGVNAQTAAEPLPAEFAVAGLEPAPWTPEDTLLRGALFALLLGGNHRVELLRARLLAEAGSEIADLLLPRSGPEAPTIIPEAALRDDVRAALRGRGPLPGLDAVDALLGDPNIVSGSNNWVVSGARTASGKPLLANDVHIGQMFPGTWHACSLHGGALDVVGYSLPGVPLIPLGHNNKVAWGMSNLGPDTQDLYVERLETPADGGPPRRYARGEEWLPLDVRTETIEVRGGAPVELEIRSTRHGPLVDGALLGSATEGPPLPPLALRWSLAECRPLIEPLWDMARAANVAEFRSALRGWDVPGQNFVFADVAGDIGYQATGRIPTRRPGHLGNAPVPGDTDDYEWGEPIPFEALPAALNPPAGYVATANQRVTDDTYPHLLCWNWFPGYRARRICDLIEARDRHTVESMCRIQLDVKSLPAERIRPAFAEVRPKGAPAAAAHAALMAWDLEFELDRVGATIYQAAYGALLRGLLARHLGATLVERYLACEYERHGSMHVPVVIAALADEHHPIWGPPLPPDAARDRRAEALDAAFHAAVDFLSKTFGGQPAAWTWGSVHTLELGHASFDRLPLVRRVFGAGRHPARGENYTVDGASFIWARPFDNVHGTAQRMVIDLADLDASVGIHLSGQSERLGSPHRTDLWAMSRAGQYAPLLRSRAAVEPHLRATLRLVPRA